jgi:hypothetical protein
MAASEIGNMQMLEETIAAAVQMAIKFPSYLEVRERASND